MSSSAIEEDNDDTQYDDWEVGDVESDLKLLRLAIAESRVNDTIKESERMDVLDEIARGRREIFPDSV
eukprot:158052-Ditylum_brightwellii.AAC.1